MAKKKVEHPKDKRPTNEEVLEEIAILKKMKPKVRQYSMFGDDNHAAIDAQITVLEKRWMTDEIYRHFEDEDEAEQGRTHALDSALDARYWLDGTEEEAPSKAWEGLVK